MTMQIDPGMLQGAIPGMSLTKAPREMPWENPPELSTIEEVIQYYTEKMLDTDVEDPLLYCLDQGISVETMAESVATSGTMNGVHSLDLAFLVNPLVRELIRYVADSANVSFIDSYSERERKKTMPYRQMRDVVREVFTESTMEQPEEVSDMPMPEGDMPKGLMSKLPKEE